MDFQTLKQYAADGYSTYSISKIEKISHTTVAYWLNKYGIKTKGALVRANGYYCKCGETNPEKFKNAGKGRKCKSICSSCHNARMNEIYKELKTKGVEYLGGQCVICNYKKCPGSLHFHHCDPNKKSLEWEKLRHHNWNRLKKELDKCELVCANCHGEIHWGRSLGGG